MFQTTTLFRSLFDKIIPHPEHGVGPRPDTRSDDEEVERKIEEAKREHDELRQSLERKVGLARRTYGERESPYNDTDTRY